MAAKRPSRAVLSHPNLSNPFSDGQTPSPQEFMQSVAMIGVLVGITAHMAFVVITSSSLQDFRTKNGVIYYSILVGTISTLLYIMCILLPMVNGYADIYATLSYLGWVFFSHCTYLILIERLIPVLPIYLRRNPSVYTQDLIRAVVPFILNIPQLGTFTLIASQIPARTLTTALRAMGNLIFLLANLALTILFIKALLSNRSNYSTIFETISLHKSFSIQLIIVGLLEIFLIIVRFLQISPSFRQSLLFWSFHININGIVCLTTFRLYIFTTKVLPKKILESKLRIESTRSKSSAYANKKSSLTKPASARSNSRSNRSGDSYV
ncbi:hypothetical protein BKA69DRAFT_1121285 [Paraphysoderma sedebokerense]|nr:hypothetical protein BKA69DRAFT_1121285 [Paraphysoderma sedebokerense]